MAKTDPIIVHRDQEAIDIIKARWQTVAAKHTRALQAFNALELGVPMTTDLYHRLMDWETDVPQFIKNITTPFVMAQVGNIQVPVVGSGSFHVPTQIRGLEALERAVEDARLADLDPSYPYTKFVVSGDAVEFRQDYVDEVIDRHTSYATTAHEQAGYRAAQELLETARAFLAKYPGVTLSSALLQSDADLRLGTKSLMAMVNRNRPAAQPTAQQD